MSDRHARTAPHPSWSLLGNLALVGLLVAAACLLLPLHDDAWWPASPPPSRWAWAAGVLAAWLGACALFLRQPRTHQAAP
ncbi:MAG: hypothetical protein IAF01_02815, partial [Xanthomonadaceae bacterium]|nr:hypothetical protein [Xanthomonadaceae bacterium]